MCTGAKFFINSPFHLSINGISMGSLQISWNQGLFFFFSPEQKSLLMKLQGSMSSVPPWPHCKSSACPAISGNHVLYYTRWQVLPWDHPWLFLLCYVSPFGGRTWGQASIFLHPPTCNTLALRHQVLLCWTMCFPVWGPKTPGSCCWLWLQWGLAWCIAAELGQVQARVPSKGALGGAQLRGMSLPWDPFTCQQVREVCMWAGSLPCLCRCLILLG